MKLAKAMVKSVEDMPKEFFCCQEQIDWFEQRRKEGYIIIDLDKRQSPQTGIFCLYCKTPINIKSPDVFVVKSEQYGRIDDWCWTVILDIDEAPYTEIL